MAMKQSNHAIKGMQRDLTVSKFSPEFAYENMNIRITARENNTLMAVTNEKGNAILPLMSYDDKITEVVLEGTPLGHCVLKDYVVIFTKGDNDYIYRINKEGDKYIARTMFSGNLNFDITYPIQTLGSYENENIQKVYWVDGINQARVINIVSEKDFTDPAQFNFARSILGGEKVIITKNPEGTGLFHSGVIQYAMSYYVKNGQESAVTYLSPLYYITPKDRGGSPDEMCNCSFNIKVKNSDRNFDGMNIYSIQRTSLDATPSVRLLSSSPIKEGLDITSISPTYVTSEYSAITTTSLTQFKVYKDNTLHELSDYSDTISFSDGEGITVISDSSQTKSILIWSETLQLSVDNLSDGRVTVTMRPIAGSTQTRTYTVDITNIGMVDYTDTNGGSTIDPTELLYKGGEEIVPYTIAQKDNTLFLGNLTIKRSSIPEDLRELITKMTVHSQYKDALTITDDSLPIYKYKGYYNYNSSQATTFKKGEDYRLGIVALHNTGKWSEALPVIDRKSSGLSYSSYADKYLLANFSAEVTPEIVNRLKELGYIAIKPVIVFPTYADRSVLAQGILSPTNYLSADRVNNSPYAISSWFARFKVVNNTSGSTVVSDSVNGTIPQFTHFGILNSSRYRMAETPCGGAGGIDERIVTFHSPDIEFDEDLREYLTNSKLRIVGYVKASANAIDYSITANSTYKTQGTVDWNYGVINYDFSQYTIGQGHRRLVTASLWRDGVVIEKTQGSGEISESALNKIHATYAVYPWGRGVLNNDWRGQTGVINRKIMSTLMYTETRYFVPSQYYNFEVEGDIYKRGITPVTVFDSNEVSIERLPIPKNSTESIGKVYQGNYSGVIPTTIEYAAEVGYQSQSSPDNTFWDNYTQATNINLQSLGDHWLYEGGITLGGYTRRFSDQCEIKYKSTPHAVFTLNNTGFYTQKLLPSAGSNDTIPTEITSAAEIPAPKQTIRASYTVDYTFPSNPNVGDYCFVFDYFTNLRGSLWRYVSTSSGNAWNKEENPPTGANTIYKLSSLGGDWFLNKLTSSIGNVTWALIKTDNVPKYSKDDLSSLLSDEKGEVGIMWLAELYRDNVGSKFGGTSESAYSNNIWIPAGETVSINDKTNVFNLEYTQGDTYFQRFDCLKTYPFDDTSKNNIVEIVSFMCETRINIDGRYDRNRGQKNNLSVTPQNFNLLNPVYSQKDNFFKYNYLSLDDTSVSRFPNTVTWTSEKVSGALTDAWTNISLASTVDLDGDKGKVVSLNTFRNEVFCFQEQGLSNIIFNPRVQISASDNVPIEISNNYKVEGKRYISNIIGCSNKWSICETVNGIYFIDNLTNALYRFDGSSITPISDLLGFRQFIGENNTLDIWNPKDYTNFRTFYDKTNDDIYFINNKYCLCYSELLQQFTSFMSYEKTPLMFNFGDKFFSVNKNKMWEQNAGDYNYFFGEYRPYYVTIVANQDESIDKIFNTVEYRADVKRNGELMPNETFTQLDVWNEYQHGTLELVNRIGYSSPLKRKFRIWRANIPRDNGNRNRIRNTWAYVKLQMNKESTDSMELHDIGVSFFE